MFVLKNAWSSIVRRKWRTLLTMFIAIIVTFGTLFGFSVLHADESATDGYNPQLVSAVIRPDAKTKATYNGADSSYTKNYLAFDAYDNYASALQAAGLTYSYALTITVPVRQSGDVKAIAGTDDQSADKTGGEMLYRSFSSLEAAHENELGRYKIVKGKQLDYSSQSKTGVLISQAFAKKNGLDVGDKFTVAFPNDAKKTIEQTVRGIYEYTEPAAAGQGSDAKLAKDNRDNVIYTAYYTFAMDGLYAADGKGWLIPDLNISFLLDSMSTYRKFEKVIKKAKLPANHELTSPTLIEHEKQIAPLRSLASSMKPMLAALWIVGAVLLLLSWGSSLLVGRRREIGNQIVIGVSRGRIAWQFMLETLLLNLVGFAVGMVVGAFAVKPLATKLADGNAVSVPGNLIWTVIWSGLGTIVVLMVIAMISVLLFRVRTLFAARSSNEVEVVDGGGTDDTATSDNAANDSDTADADDTAESAQEQA